MSTPIWPSHKPHATLHQILLDGVARDLPTEQIIYESTGLATEEMVEFYRDSVATTGLLTPLQENS
jgi:hypothetical protein